MSDDSFPLTLALPRRKTQMPIQGMRKNIRKTHCPNRHVNHTTANILRVPILHVKTRHNHRKHENHRRKTNRIPQSVRVACKMRPLLCAFECAARKRAVAGRVLALPKSAPMQNPQISAFKFSEKTSPSLIYRLNLLFFFYNCPHMYEGWVDLAPILPYALMMFCLFVEIFVVCEFFISVKN
jgi:hypothetical protein